MAVEQQQHGTRTPTPFKLVAFTYALMGPACGINGAFIALSIPPMAQFGLQGLIAAAAIGAVLGILPALWLARRIHDGLREDE